MTQHQVGLRGRLQEQNWRLRPGGSCTATAVGAMLDPLISRTSPNEVEIGRLTRPSCPFLGAFYRAGGDLKCTLVIVSGLKEAPGHQLPENRRWSCTKHVTLQCKLLVHKISNSELF